MAASADIGKKEDLKRRLDEAAINALQKMCTDRDERTVKAQAGDATALDGGFWYGSDLHDLWTVADRVDELTQMKKKGRLYHGNAPTTYWQKPRDVSGLYGRAFLVFQLKSNKVPSEALDAQGVWVLDCSTAIKLARLKALQAVVPFFDEIFACDGPAPLQIGDKDPNGMFSPLLPLMVARKVSSFEDVLRGDLIGIKGGSSGCKIPNEVENIGGKILKDTTLYQLKHKHGDASNFNVLCTGVGEEGPRCLGFGLDVNGVSLADVSKALLNGYNEAPIIPGDILSPEKEKVVQDLEGTSITRSYRVSLEKHQMTPEQFEAQGGGEMMNYVTAFNVNRVAQLAAVKTQSEGRELMVRWMKELRERKV